MHMVTAGMFGVFFFAVTELRAFAVDRRPGPDREIQGYYGFMVLAFVILFRLLEAVLSSFQH